MPKVSDEHKDNVRRKIMDAALTCLERNDFQDVTTRELLSEAGLSTGTFYNYFPSKEHLYEALAEERLSLDIAEVIDDSRPLGESLLVFVRDFLLTQRDGAVPIARFRSQASNSPSGADAVDRLNRWMLDQFVPIVRTAQADGIIDPALDPEAFVELLDIVYDGMGRRAASDAFQTSYARVGASLLAVLLGGAIEEPVS
jgi:TetR/AcrR family transcriptional regulator, repressor for uid operon